MKIDLREFAGNVKSGSPRGGRADLRCQRQYHDHGATAPVTAEADSGTITLTDAHDNVSLTTSNGPVKAQLAAGWHGKLVRIESSNGALDLNVSPGFRGALRPGAGRGTVHNALRPVKGAPLVFMLTQSGNVTVAADIPVARESL